MKWTTQRKAALAVLILAGAAFCVDRFILGYSAPAAAVAATETADAALSVQGPVTPALVPVSLTQRLAQIDRDEDADESDPRDAFALPASWKAPAHPKDQIAPTSVKDAKSREFTLTTVITAVGDRPAVARINGRLVKVGDQINGCTLLRIEGGRSYTAVLSPPASEDARSHDSSPEIRVPLSLKGEASEDPAEAPTPRS